MTRWILGAVATMATLLAVAPAPAAAAPFPPRAERAFRIAVEYWGQESSPACASVDREVVPDELLASENADARATIPAPDAEPGSVSCLLEVRRSLMPLSRFYYLCSVMIHEVGHLNGLGHSSDPRSIMYGGGVTTIPRPCHPGVPDATGYESDIEKAEEMTARCQRLRTFYCWQTRREIIQDGNRSLARYRLIVSAL